MSRWRWTVLVAVVAMLSTSCSLSAGTLEFLRDRHEGTSGTRSFDSLDGLLANTRYSVGDAPASSLTAAVVVGRFESVAPGRAFTVPGGDAPGGQEADFDDPDAAWKTVEASFAVDQVVSGEAIKGSPLTVGISFGPDVDAKAVERDLRGLGHVALFLEKSPVFAYDPRVYGIVGDGALIASIDDEGALSLPVFEDSEAAQLLTGTPTLAALAAAAAGPERTFEMDPTGTEVIREIVDNQK